MKEPYERAFVTTRWTQVLSARGDSPEAHLALGELCTAYWMPVFRFVQRQVHEEEGARDLTQAFFTQLLAGHGLDGFEPSKGRFRSYLLGAVRHFLSDQKDRACAAKRGGNQTPVDLESPTDSENRTLEISDPSTPVPDAFFDRQWALNVIQRALEGLEKEFADAGKQTFFTAMKPWLIGDAQSLVPGTLTQQLGLSEGAAKVALHRFRKRFRELVKDEIAGTVDHPSSVQDELRYLLEALSHA